MKDYLLLVQAPARRLPEGGFVTEGAFAEHLRLLRRLTAAHFGRLVLAAPEYDAAEADRLGAGLSRITPDEGIDYLPLHPTTAGRLGFWRRDAARVWRALHQAISQAEVVHSGLSDDLWRPALLFANTLARLQDKKLLFVVDIDFRSDTQRYYQTGVWSRRAYWLNRLVYDPLKLAQVKLAPQISTLVLLKSNKMVEELGQGATHVRNFYDTVHSAEDVLSATETELRRRALGRAERPLNFGFFGRYVAYKGVDRMLDALALARRRSKRKLTLTLIGQGPEEAALRQRAEQLGLLGPEPAVRFLPQRPYGASLFEAVDTIDVQLATPLVEDTPRAAFDALARGLPILAFDITYYQDLADGSGAVSLVPWEGVDELADKMIALDKDRAQLQAMCERAVRFARHNTQEIWLERRIRWTLEAVKGAEPAPVAPLILAETRTKKSNAA